MKPITPNQHKALCIIRDNPNISGGLFSNLFWPDSPLHTKGKYPAAGVGAWLNGGRYLGKLKKRGLIRVGTRVTCYVIEQAGLSAIEDYEKETRPKP